MKNLNDLHQLIADNTFDRAIEFLDLRYADMWGAWHHVSLPIKRVDEKLLQHGVAFDGSSLGIKSVSAGDMVLIPDLQTLHFDPFFEHGTLGVICNIAEADSLQGYANDPRSLVQRAEALLSSLGLAEHSLWGPEFEFYIFDQLLVDNGLNFANYRVEADEAQWNCGQGDRPNLGGHIASQAGYHIMPPYDQLNGLRAEMSLQIEAMGVPVRYHHHEVGSAGQCEIEILLLPLLRAADAVMQVKYVTRMVAREAGKTVTYMPKPLYGQAGTGMHFHQALRQGEQSLFYDAAHPAGLSQLGRYYVGGLLKHGRALLALTNPSTNSYKRLVPGFEAPVHLCYGLANRGAAVRIPKYVGNSTDMRIEFRPPDGTANPYLSMAAQLMAGIDGIVNKIDADELGMGPISKDLRLLSDDEKSKISPVPKSLEEALQALADDQDFLLRGGVFNKERLQSWRQTKMQREVEAVRDRPHPYEMSLYFDA